MDCTSQVYKTALRCIAIDDLRDSSDSSVLWDSTWGIDALGYTDRNFTTARDLLRGVGRTCHAVEGGKLKPKKLTGEDKLKAFNLRVQCLQWLGLHASVVNREGGD